MMHASTFDDNYFTNVQVIEFPDNLNQPQSLDEEEGFGEMIVDETSYDPAAKTKTNIVSLKFIEET